MIKRKVQQSSLWTGLEDTIPTILCGSKHHFNINVIMVVIENNSSCTTTTTTTTTTPTTTSIACGASVVVMTIYWHTNTTYMCLIINYTFLHENIYIYFNKILCTYNTSVLIIWLILVQLLEGTSLVYCKIPVVTEFEITVDSILL